MRSIYRGGYGRHLPNSGEASEFSSATERKERPFPFLYLGGSTAEGAKKKFSKWHDMTLKRFYANRNERRFLSSLYDTFYKYDDSDI